MEAQATQGLLRFFRTIPDSRAANARHLMSDILSIAILAVDGKTLRRSWKRAWSKTPVHLVSAFASKNNLVLGQIATDSKSKEITAIPKLLAMLDLAGMTVTIDAMGCQREIASQIVGQKGPLHSGGERQPADAA